VAGVDGWIGDDAFDDEQYSYDEEPNDEHHKSSFASRTTHDGYNVGYTYPQSYTSQQHFTNAGNSGGWS
jgi:hypothetical protein